MSPFPRVARSLVHVAVAAIAAATASPAAAEDIFPFVPREAVARLAPGTNAAAFAAQFGATLRESIPSRNIHRFAVPPALSEPEFIDLIDDDPRVLFTELNFIADDRNPDGNTQSIFVLRDVDAYLDQTAAQVIGLPQANARATGAGVLVAVIDSGIDPLHPVFRGRTPFRGVDLIDNDTTPVDARDNIDNDGDTLVDELVGHGTLVAGVVLRVAPAAAILPIRVLDSDGGSTTFRMIEGIYTAIDRGADIINLSLGTPAPSPLIADAVAEAVAANRLVVCAAGNDATDQTLRFPAGFSGPGLLAVAATNNADRLAPFSNFGAAISIAAPGDPVLGPVPGNAFGSARGTSFAAPIVSGVAALVRSLTPCLPATDVQARLLNTATNIDALNPNFAGSLGAGRINAAAAVGFNTLPLPFNADLNADRVVDIEDLYFIHQAPRDINADGLANQADRDCLEAFIRRWEHALGR